MRRFIAVALLGLAVAACENTEADLGGFDVLEASVVEGVPSRAPDESPARMQFEKDGDLMHSFVVMDGERIHVHTSERVDTSHEPECQPAGVTCSRWETPLWAASGRVVAYALRGEETLHILTPAGPRDVPLGEGVRQISPGGGGSFLVNGAVID